MFTILKIIFLQEYRRNRLTKLQQEALASAKANAAIEMEQKILQEIVGSQDQIACAVGGINEISFGPGVEWVNRPITLPDTTVHEIENSAVLIFSGIQIFLTILK